MDTTNVEAMSPAEREIYAAMVERMRQLRRRSGVPDGVTVEEAVALHMVSAEEVARARWGDPGLPAPTPPTAEWDGFHPT
jgi:hypothetical protein